MRPSMACFTGTDSVLLTCLLLRVQGFEKLRFAAPVRSGARIRAVFVLGGISVRPTGWVQFTYAVTMEIEGMAKPALKATWLTVSKVDPGRSRL